MNFLAHIALAAPTVESLIGNLAGDFVKGPLHDRFTPGIRAGIVMHRRIDSFTDSHPAVAEFRAVLTPEHRHYSRVIADVFFDHFLASDFEQLFQESLEAFIARTHDVLDRHADELPGRLRVVYPVMRDQQWLLSYREIAGIETALRNMSRRLLRPHRLDTAVHHLTASRDVLRDRFHRFFPDALSFAREISRDEVEVR